jgi:hypothetical protein
VRDLTDQGTPLPPNFCGCFCNSARFRLEKKLRVVESSVEQEIGKTLYRVGESKKRRKKTDFGILRVPEDGRMLPTISKEVREIVQCETCESKESERRSCIFPGSAFSIGFNENLTVNLAE